MLKRFFIVFILTAFAFGCSKPVDPEVEGAAVTGVQLHGDISNIEVKDNDLIKDFSNEKISTDTKDLN